MTGDGNKIIFNKKNLKKKSKKNNEYNCVGIVRILW